MAEKTPDTEKEARKAAEKAKQERIKQSKPKKEGSVFDRIIAAVKKFFKDFIGTCKKIVWPNGKTVIKNSLVVLVTIIVIGALVGLIDLGLTKLVDLSKDGVIALAEYVGDDETEAEETTEAEELTEAAEETTEAEEETEAEAEETAEAADETTEAAE